MSIIRSSSECCHICKSEHPPIASRKVQPGRSVKLKAAKAHIDWIKCDACKNWCHCECGGINARDYKKLTSNVQQYYKCIVCCIAASCCIIDVKFSNITHFNEENTTSESPPGSADSSARNTLDESTLDGKLLDTAQGSVGECGNIVKDKERLNIILVDNIRYPAQFIKSSSILKEVKNYAPEVQVKYAYSLAKGGVAIHLNTTEDKELLIQSLTKNQTAFGGGKVSNLSDKRDSVFIENVSTHICNDTVKVAVENAIKGEGANIQDHCDSTVIQRLSSRNSGRPVPVVKVVGTTTVISRLLQAKDIVVAGKVCRVARRKPVVYRCYNCQRFGHIAKACNRQKRCINCGRNHINEGYCTAPVACANCNGPHRASCRDCPEFKRNYENLAGKCQEFEYNKGSVGSDITGSQSRPSVVAGDMECQRQSATTGLHGSIG